MTKFLRLLTLVFAVAFWLFSAAHARADELSDAIKELGSADRDKVEQAVDRVARAPGAGPLMVLDALLEGTLRLDAQGVPFIAGEGGSLKPALEGGPDQPSGQTTTPDVDNRLRRQLEPKIASLRLSFPDSKVRLAAAEDLAKRRSDDLAPLVRQALEKEQDPGVRKMLALALAQTDLNGNDRVKRLSALAAIEEAAAADFKPAIDRILEKDSSGAFKETDEEVRRAAGAALSAIELRALWVGMLGNLFYGISLGSVLLLAALGLAITFGLMRVINMAHGELLMIGAYATFAVQQLFLKHLPGAADLYLIAAVPVAFVVCMAIGMALERTVIRFLYGRPLETLLATWGISLVLIQTVRLIYGAQNVTVANPKYLAGGIEVLPGFVLTYSRLAVIAFSSAVIGFVWLILQKTALGLHVRAVTQNREVAAAMGIPTRKVDLWTFGVGSGVAGLGGVALSQLGNVGPELGQQYIVDSFMVVVLGGVGKLAGTLAGALGLGVINKLLEPAAGAVLGKIVVLIFIILFIQRRPQGIFALKGRAAEVM
jgi:urea transport system permease protein